jgi:hypothetical protein
MSCISVGMRVNVVNFPAWLICGASDVEDQTVLLDQKTLLDGMRVIRLVKSNAENAGGVDRFLINGNKVQDDGKFVEERLMHNC